MCIYINIKIVSYYLKGTFLITQTICRELVEKNLSGSIVNIGSIVAQRGNIGQCNYSASKAAVEVFSKTVALEMAKLVKFKFLMSKMILNYIHSEQITDTFSKFISNLKSLINPLISLLSVLNTLITKGIIFP